MEKGPVRQGERLADRVVNGPLGTFDPTLLQNDDYQIRVWAQDVNGQQTYSPEILVHLDGAAKIGNFHLEYTDLQIPLAGIPITIARIYDTLQADQQGDFGFGWTLAIADANIHETVVVNPGGFFAASPFKVGTKVYLTNPEGRRVGFTWDPILQPGVPTPEGLADPPFGPLYLPYFRPDPGVFDKLEVEAVPLAKTPDGKFGLYGFGFPYNPDDYTLTTKDGTRYAYNQFSGLQTITDTNVNTLTFTDAGIFSSTGQSIQFVRDTLDRITQIVDPAGHTLTYVYTTGGDLEIAVNQIGNASHYEYWETLAHYMKSINDEAGCACSLDSSSLFLAFGPDGRLQTVEDALGNMAQSIYDLSHFTEQVADRLGNITTLVYDTRGNIVSETNALGDSWTYTFDSNDNEVSVTDPNGHAISRTFDARGNMLSITDALNQTAYLTYNEFNLPTSLVDGNGGLTTFQYDVYGKVIGVVDPAGFVTTQARDAQGRVISITDAEGRTTSFEYGSVFAAPTRTVYADGSDSQVVFDGLGLIIQEIDPLHNSRFFTYDGLGRLLTTTDENGHVVAQGYDSRNRLISVTDGSGNVTSYEYDDADRLTAESTSAGRRTWQYDAAGNLVRFEDRNGRITTFQYNAEGIRIAETWFNSASSSVPLNTIHSRYDPAGNLVELWDDFSHYTFTFDERDLVTTVDNAGTAGVPRMVLTYQYDANGNIIAVTDDRGTQVSSSYDLRNILTSRAWTGPELGSAAVSFTYDRIGAIIAMQRSYAGIGAGSTTFSYDVQGRLQRLSHYGAAGALFADYTYSYDAANQLIGEQRLTQSATYAYDPAGQLTSAGFTAQTNASYSYDANGNRTDQGTNVIAANRLLADDRFDYAYDAEGNLIQKTDRATGVQTSFAYDPRNRLVSAEVRTAQGDLVTFIEYRYDVFDRRIARVVDGVPQYTVYDRENVWADFDDTGTVTARYLLGDGYDLLLARWRADGVAWYLSDNLGTVRDVVDAAGAVVLDHIEYDPFGQVVSESNPAVGDRFKFTGRPFDAALSLYDFRTRVYDPYTGRFNSEDLLGFESGDYNLYRYAENSPLVFVDPLGTTTIAEYSKKKSALTSRILKAAKCLGFQAASEIGTQAVAQGVYVILFEGGNYAGRSYGVDHRLRRHLSLKKLPVDKIKSMVRIATEKALRGKANYPLYRALSKSLSK